ncbi:MAG: rod shape-determining protein RodA, partial [Pseudomonadota bacterium]
SLPLFFAGVLLLIATLLVGDIGKGAQRWLDLRVMRFQPSEILKIATPMMAAWVMDQAHLPPRWYHLLTTLILVLIPVYLIYKQPDLGTAVLVLGAGVAVMFLAGISWQLLLGTLGGAVAIAPLIWKLLRPYQQQRILTFLDPESDPLESGYHIIQATIAVGSGGLYGKGWLMGTQSHLEFLPERSTDFIFAVLAEEFGLTGILVLFGFYLFIIMRGLQMAIQAQDNYNRLLAGAISLAFFLYVIVNTGMVTGILPVVGVPLPLVSYGGTSLVTIMAGFGILMSVHTHRRWIPA